MKASVRDSAHLEGSIRTITVSLIGAAALAAGIFLLKQQMDVGPGAEPAPAGESVPGSIVLERLREAGI